MSLLNFLKSSTVEDKRPAPGKTGGAKKQWNPAPGIVAIRVWKDGSIFPSHAAKDKFDLEYRLATIVKELIPGKEGDTEPKYRNTYEFPDGTGNGFDLIDSRSWNQIKGADGAMLFVALVPKNAGKVDMFNTVSYEDDGMPKTSVMDQGAVTFGQQVLIPAIEEVYGIKFAQDAVEPENGTEEHSEEVPGADFVDLAIFEEFGEGSDKFDVTKKYSTPFVFIPKKVTRGKEKGKDDYVRRENAKVYGLAPAEMIIPGYKVEKAAAKEEAVLMIQS